MVYPFTGNPYKQNRTQTNMGTLDGEEEPQGAAVKGSVFGAFLAMLPWLILGLIGFYQWLMTAVR